MWLMGLEEFFVFLICMDFIEVGVIDMNFKFFLVDIEYGKCDEYRYGLYRGRYLL